MLDEVQNRLALDTSMTRGQVEAWTNMKHSLQKRIIEREVEELKVSRTKIEKAYARARALRKQYRENRARREQRHEDNRRRIELLRRERDLLQQEQDALEKVKQTEAEAWAAEELQDKWSRILSREALGRRIHQIGRQAMNTVQSRWERVQNSDTVQNIQMTMNLAPQQINTFAERVGEGDWDGAHDMLPGLLQGMISAVDSGEIVSVAAVTKKAEELLKKVRIHADRMESVRASWTRVTGRLLTSEQKRRITRMWDYIITFVVNMNLTLQSRRRLPKRTVALVELVLKDLHDEVVVPFMHITTHAAAFVQQQGKGGKGGVSMKVLHEDVKDFMTGLRRLQSLMMKLDFEFSSEGGVADVLQSAGRWISNAMSSVMSVFSHYYTLTILQALEVLNVTMFKTTWMASSAFQLGTQWIASTSWEYLVLRPHRSFIKQLICALESAKKAGVDGKQLQKLKEQLHEAIKPGAAMHASGWRARLARLLFRLMRSFSNGSWKLPDYKTKSGYKPFNIKVNMATGPSNINVGTESNWPETEDADGQSGWGYRVVAFPYKLTVMFAEVMLRLLGRVFTGNLISGLDTWAEAAELSEEERNTRSWWRSLLGSLDSSNDTYLFGILKTLFIMLLFPKVVKLLFGFAKGTVKRLFGSASSVSDGVLNNRGTWQCDEDAAKCRAVLVPRDKLGKVFTSRKECDIACTTKSDPIEDAYHWEMEYM